MGTDIYLIRHGEAVCNARGFFAGMRSDTGLTEHGVTQARRLRDRLKATGEIAADVLIASTLPRALETAEIIAPALGLDIIPDEEVQEIHPGDADGLYLSEFIERFGPLPDFREDAYRPVAPGGESWGDFVTRAGRALHRIAREHAGKTVVVVCHGGVVDASLLIGLGIATVAPAMGQFHTRNTSITQWEREKLETMERWRLIRYNDDVHTQDIGSPQRIRWPRLTRERVRAAEPAVPLPTETDRDD